MSWRIEQTDALTLLLELPDRWAQTCITNPPPDGEYANTLAILTEMRRVLRDDGTLWLLHPSASPLLADIHDAGWISRRTPHWTRPHTSNGIPTNTRLSLLTKHAGWYFYDAHTSIGRARSQRPPRPGVSRQARRAQTCYFTRDHEQRLRLTRRCVMSGSSPLACGECGAPYERAHPGASVEGPRYPTCPHNNPDGRCLILDPFYRPANLTTATVALCTGRSFLGITNTRRGQIQ